MAHLLASYTGICFGLLDIRSAALWKALRRVSGAVCCTGGILLSIPSYANTTPDWTLAYRFGGRGTDIGQAVKTDRDGNSYVTGAFSATAHFPSQPASAGKFLVSDGGTDTFIAKYDGSGVLKWLIQIGGPGDDQGFDIDFDAARNVYVTGGFTDSATFQGMSNSTRTVTGSGGQTSFVAKYSPSGVLAWVQTGSAYGFNTGFGVAVEPATGSVYMTGVSQGDTTFSSSNGAAHTVSGTGFWHMFLVGFDVSGNFLWGATSSASPNSIGHKVAVDADNNPYVTGWMEGNTDFSSNDGHDQVVNGFSFPVQTYPDYPNDAFVVKYNEHGNLQWVNQIGGYKAIGTDIATSRDGRISVTGFIGNVNDSPSQAATIVTSQPGGNNINLGAGQVTAPYNKDMFLATYDEDGALLDAQRFGGPGDDGGSGIAYDRRGNLIVAGIFQGSITFAGRTLSGKDPYNLFVAKFSRTDALCLDGLAAHRLAWAVEADGPSTGDFENNPRIGLNSVGDVMVTGSYQPTAQFGDLKLNPAGSTDGFLAVLKSNR